MSTAPRVLITGAAGYVGRQLATALAERVSTGEFGAVVGTDVREWEAASRPAALEWVTRDVREPGLEAVLQLHNIDVVVHLAAIVTPGPKSTRDFEYSVDVGGTRAVLDACIAAGVRRVVVTSSGAAYGYYGDHPEWISEDAPIRGNREFAYAHHKRLVEEMLAAERVVHPALEQVVLRVTAVLGETVNNQITALFQRPRLLALTGSSSPFTFIHDTDLVAVLVRAVTSPATGVFNVAGDGALTIDEIAVLLGKPVLRIPPWLLAAALTVARPFGLTRYGPEQVMFLRWRPVLSNRRLKEGFGYVPRFSSRNALLAWRDRAGRGERSEHRGQDGQR